MAKTGKSTAPKPPRGRPRDPSLDEAIIRATSQRLADDGYSQMTLGDIAADAGVTRPTIYRRWAGKFELVMDALDSDIAAEEATFPAGALEDMPPKAALAEAIRRIDPCYFRKDAMLIAGNFMAEFRRTPELLAMVSKHGVEPRFRLVEGLLELLIERGHVRKDLDVQTTATMCFGAYFGSFMRYGEEIEGLGERVVETLWPLISTEETKARKPTRRRATKR